jgi:hypothetical protein
MFLRTPEYYQGLMFLTTNRVVKTAGAVAKYEGKGLTFTHIELAIKGREDFEVDVKGAGATESSNMFR